MKLFSNRFDPCPLNDNPEVDGLHIDWKDKTFVNPPYSNPLPWVEKAIKEAKNGNMIVMLLRVDTSTRWFAKLNEAGAEILWFSKRLKFKRRGYKGGGEEDKLFTYIANFPSMLVIL